jgi:hypothetical protein
MTGAIADSFQNPVAPSTAIWFLIVLCALCFAWGFIAERRKR